MTISKKELNSVIKWTRDYLNSYVPSGTYQAIVGLSGGIDSAVTASVCARAVGADKVLGVLLPCESKKEDEILATKLSGNLTIDALTISLDDPFNKWKEMFGYTTDKLIMGNTKARLRMLTLYATAAQYGGLVIGTTNKTEEILGYATKYGDNAVDIEPLMEFYKTEIWEMADLLGDIPEEIIHRIPTAGLWEGQTDEGELGMSYKQIDNYLINVGIDNIITHPTEETKKIVSLYKNSRHKNFHLPHYERN